MCIRDRSEPERRENLWKITNYALDCFRQAGFEIGDTESPIIPLYVRDTDKTFSSFSQYPNPKESRRHDAIIGGQI